MKGRHYQSIKWEIAFSYTFDYFEGIMWRLDGKCKIIALCEWKYNKQEQELTTIIQISKWLFNYTNGNGGVPMRFLKFCTNELSIRCFGVVGCSSGYEFQRWEEVIDTIRKTFNRKTSPKPSATHTNTKHLFITQKSVFIPKNPLILFIDLYWRIYRGKYV